MATTIITKRALVFVTSVVILGFLGPVNGFQSSTSIDSSTLPNILATEAKTDAEGPTFLDLFKNFNISEQIPNSAFQRFLVHLGRVMLVALIVCLWFLLVIQVFVCIGKCFECFSRCFRKKGGASGDGDVEETLAPSKTSAAIVEKCIGKGGNYQKNYVNRTHSMPILIFKK